jgi:hypothetical protein
MILVSRIGLFRVHRDASFSPSPDLGLDLGLELRPELGVRPGLEPRPGLELGRDWGLRRLAAGVGGTAELAEP